MAKPRLNSVAGAVTAFGLQGQMDRYWGGGDVLWVGNRSGLAAGDGTSPSYPMSSLVGTAGALAKLNATTNRGHVIFVMPGHAETVNAADWASATGAANSFALVGIGKGTSAPSLTWSTATSTWLWDTANVWMDNFQIFSAGDPALTAALSVAAPITISAPGCGMRNLEWRFGVDADQLTTIGITTTAAATGLCIEDCRFTSPTTAECTTFMDIIGVDRLSMRRNYFAGATSSTGVGIVRFATTASLDIVLEQNVYINRKAASAAAVTGLAGVSGSSREELFHYLDNASTTAWLTSPGIMAFYNARLVNLAGEHGMLPTVIST
jgi:hypothetical protein